MTGKLKNDCFALPVGTYWTPVSDALAHLQSSLSVVVGRETIETAHARGRVIADDVLAQRSHPPRANSAVDGYGLAWACLSETENRIPIVGGRAAAGADFDGSVPFGSACRILTGAAIPNGVDTVILQEDVDVEEDTIVFNGRGKKYANKRNAGEDVNAGDTIFAQGHKITPADMALLAATGVATLPVFKRLTVAILSTGDELVDDANDPRENAIVDANRPMLKSMFEQFGCAVVDLGISADNRETVRSCLDKGAKQADLIVTTGGASAGDEDHISALLNDTGSMALWRIAIKPGRPLALAFWDGVPVFGLPGNPVAAFVCSLVFARPTVMQMSGQGWNAPRGFMVAAGFEKSKKEGRSEYLRARLDGDQVEVFASEGSGRISGLSWANGLVELDAPARDIKKGDLVRFIPFAAFGL